MDLPPLEPDPLPSDAPSAPSAPPAGVAAAPPPPPPALPPAIGRRSAFVAAVLGWAVPGLGQIYAGTPLKALIMAATIGCLFYAGLAMTGFTCVDPDVYGLEFAAHIWIGGPTAWAYWSSREIVLSTPLPYFEVGRLYVAVAGLLNIVALCDAMGSVLDHNAKADEREAERAAIEDAHLAALDALEAAAAKAQADENALLETSAPIDGTAEADPAAGPGSALDADPDAEPRGAQEPA